MGRRETGARGRRGWKKLHLGVDGSGVIVAQALTDAHVDDATTGVTLIDAVDSEISSVTADAAYDTVAVYETARARMRRSWCPRSGRRTCLATARGRPLGSNDHISEAARTAPLEKASGYHRQARAENAFFRYKSIIGDGLRARSQPGRGVRPSRLRDPESDDRPRPASVV